MHPLLLTPILKPKVWGGRRLSRYNKQLPPDTDIGESWELADLASTSPSGGGGAPARSIVSNGPHAGRTLHDLIDLWGDGLIPRTLLTASGDFPLLVKFLDAREHLSIQVHPSPAYAQTHPDAHLKTECWFVLNAVQPGSAPSPRRGSERRGEGRGEGRAANSAGAPTPPTPPSPRSSKQERVEGAESVLYKGLRPGITPDILRRLIADNRVPEAMLAVPAIPGQMHDLPSGTIHALGAGVLVAEVQTPSDTTFRVYDWANEYARTGRELHIEQSLECIDFGPPPTATALPATAKAGTLVRTPFFTIDQARLPPGDSLSLATPGCQVLMLLEGSGTLKPASSTKAAFDPIPIAHGHTILIPAAIAQSVTLTATNAINMLRIGIGP